MEKPSTNPATFAREVVHASMNGGVLPEPPDELFYRQPAACFVSIKGNGQLRGCIGTLEPAESQLGLELIRNARLAAFEDPRFAPLTREDYPHLVFSVDVLSRPQNVATPAELDCEKYGVIVSCDYRRGVLLPDLEGVDGVEHQLAIACQKAGIGPNDSYAIQRFTVERFEEGKSRNYFPHDFRQ